MIIGVHTLIYASQAGAARVFFRDVLGFPAVDAGQGWLIMACPPAEMGVHPLQGDRPRHEMYLMCDDIEKTMAELRSRGAEFEGGVSNQGWGLVTSLKLPGGEKIGLYEPRHPMAIKRGKAGASRKARRARKAPGRRTRKAAPRRGKRPARRR